MAVIDQAVVGRPRVGFAEEHDIDEFVDVLGKFERGEISPEEWRKFRLVKKRVYDCLHEKHFKPD